MRSNIRNDERGDHQNVDVGHEVGWVTKIEPQRLPIEEKYECHGVGANRPYAVLYQLAITRCKKRSKSADQPKGRHGITETAKTQRLRRTHEKRRESGFADGLYKDSTKNSVKAVRCIVGGELRIGMGL